MKSSSTYWHHHHPHHHQFYPLPVQLSFHLHQHRRMHFINNVVPSSTLNTIFFFPKIHFVYFFFSLFQLFPRISFVLYFIRLLSWQSSSSCLHLSKKTFIFLKNFTFIFFYFSHFFFFVLLNFIVLLGKVRSFSVIFLVWFFILDKSCPLLLC